MSFPCPHCTIDHRAPGNPPYCPDTRRWTTAERDAWRAQARRENPGIAFAPSTAQLAARFGARNRADRASS